ncbi:hypothetical protein F01_200229 [Burkholderia cenocepacia]|nr:hypothetical protein F01_200229 [Burkholderia cenocepacia]
MLESCTFFGCCHGHLLCIKES